MTRFKRPVAAAGAAVLLAFSLSACGGGDAADAPTDASKDDFCESWNAAFENLSTGEPSEEDFEKFQDAVAELSDVGTPDGISEEQRDGFEVFVDAVADASSEDLQSDEIPGVSEDDSAKAQAFVEYAVTECTDLGDVPTDIPTE